MLGSLAAFQVRWLVERNKAERLRIAKFRYLIDPELWSGDPAVESRKRAEIDAEVKRIEAVQHKDVQHWIENDAVPTAPESILGLATPPPVMSELIDYYRKRRLDYQLAFFTRRANENLKLNAMTKYLSPAAAFSVASVRCSFTSATTISRTPRGSIRSAAG